MNDAKTTVKARDTQQITIRTDSREILANARRDIARFDLSKYFIVDVDSHHVELDSWGEILDYIEDPVLRRSGKTMSEMWPNARNLALSNHPPGLTFQDVSGRIPHQAQLGEHVEPQPGEHRDLTLVRRALESMGIDIQIVFPQPMLEIGLHPSAAVETAAHHGLQPVVHRTYSRARTPHSIAARAPLQPSRGLSPHDP